MMELQANDVVDKYKGILAETSHQLILAQLTIEKLTEENTRLRTAVGAPSSADPVLLGPRVPATPPDSSPGL